jgi:DNA mismatch repair protein MutS
VPRDMIELAKTKLTQLEQEMTVIPVAIPQETRPSVSSLEKWLTDIEPDSLTPREALELLYQLKEMMRIKH